VDVALRELPALRRVGETVLQPTLLLASADVQVELQDRRSLFRELAFELVDRAVPSFPRRAPDLAVYARHQHVLVVTSVEQHDLAHPRDAGMDPPEEVVLALLGRRSLEGDDPDALRVDPFEDPPDRPVLPRGIHSLEEHEQRVSVLGVQQLLERVEELLEPLEPRATLVLRSPEPAIVSGVESREPYAGAGSNAVPIHDPDPAAPEPRADGRRLGRVPGREGP
jgi:hypothetical protein